MIEGVILCLCITTYLIFYDNKKVTFREDLNSFHIYDSYTPKSFKNKN